VKLCLSAVSTAAPLKVLHPDSRCPCGSWGRNFPGGRFSSASYILERVAQWSFKGWPRRVAKVCHQSRRFPLHSCWTAGTHVQGQRDSPGCRLLCFQCSGARFVPPARSAPVTTSICCTHRDSASLPVLAFSDVQLPALFQQVSF